MPYDPDYDLHKEPSLAGPSLAYIEDGLRAGESYISKYMEREIPLIKQYHTDSGLVTVAHLEEYCKKNELIISPTDKNLGACVVTREEDVQIDNQPQNLIKYQMYFKRRVIILTLGVYNLNIQKNFKCLQTF